MKKLFLIFGLCAFSFINQAQNEPYKNVTLSTNVRAEDLLSRLTL
jgi:hypothetical protein